MKFLSAITLIIWCFLNTISAQDAKPKKSIYQLWVSTYQKPLTTRGILYEIKDSSILVLQSFVIQDYSIDSPEIVQLYINDIITIKTRKKGDYGGLY